MKKVVICASVVGLVAGVIYCIFKKGKSNTATDQMVDNKVDANLNIQKEDTFKNTGAVEKMYKAKSESVQAVYERHFEAGSLMKDAYSDIMQDFVEEFSSEDDTNTKDKEVIIENESVSIMKEIDVISDEIDDLLKE